LSALRLNVIMALTQAHGSQPVGFARVR